MGRKRKEDKSPVPTATPGYAPPAIQRGRSWGSILGGVATVLGIVGGSFALYDRFIKEPRRIAAERPHLEAETAWFGLDLSNWGQGDSATSVINVIDAGAHCVEGTTVVSGLKSNLKQPATRGNISFALRLVNTGERPATDIRVIERLFIDRVSVYVSENVESHIEQGHQDDRGDYLLIKIPTLGPKNAITMAFVAARETVRYADTLGRKMWLLQTFTRVTSATEPERDNIIRDVAPLASLKPESSLLQALDVYTLLGIPAKQHQLTTRTHYFLPMPDYPLCPADSWVTKFVAMP